MKFEKLKAEEIECRVQTVNEKGCSLLLYKTARVDAKMLDETVGAENWQNDFKEIDGVLYGGIAIKSDNGEWVYKWDCGTESNTEADKGRASDAFKRAGFKWGIGRELYSAPFIWVVSTDLKKHWQVKGKTDRYGKPVWTCADRFKVTDIAYDGDKIVELVIYNTLSNKKVFELHKPVVPDMATINAEIKTLKLTDENIEEIKSKYQVKDLKDMTDDQKIELGQYLGQKLLELKNEDTKQD